MMIADNEDMQDSEASEINVKRFKSQEVFVKAEDEFSCANGSLRLPYHPDRHR